MNLLRTYLLSSAVQTKLGTRQNPLFKTSNVTLRCDAKIFNSDSLATINNLAASNTYFQTRCAAVLSKMLNLVPSSVVLSSPLAPVTVKPTNVRVVADVHRPVSFSGYIRVCDNNNKNRVHQSPNKFYLSSSSTPLRSTPHLQQSRMHLHI